MKKSNPKKAKKLPKLLYADAAGNIFDHPYLTMAGMSGTEAVLPEEIELIPLPEDSRLFTIPDTPPIAWDGQQQKFVTVSTVREGRREMPVQAVSAFMAPGWMRTLLPACDYSRKKVQLPLWSYTAVGWDEESEQFVVAATRVDANENWQPQNYDDRQLDPLVRKMLKAVSGQPAAGAALPLCHRLSLLCRQKSFLPPLGSADSDLAGLQLALSRLHQSAAFRLLSVEP